MRIWLACAGLALLGGCGGGKVVPAPATASSRPIPLPASGLERVLGQNARALTGLFGKPDLDVREANARKLQFGNGKICVLDAYLYAKKSGAEPVVSWVDARKPDGSDVDRVGCVEALSKR